jgi:hypothetical protein
VLMSRTTQITSSLVIIIPSVKITDISINGIKNGLYDKDHVFHSRNKRPIN